MKWSMMQKFQAPGRRLLGSSTTTLKSRARRIHNFSNVAWPWQRGFANCAAKSSPQPGLQSTLEARTHTSRPSMSQKESTMATSKLLQHAGYLSKTWPTNTRLDHPRENASAETEAIIPMTTNFLIYIRPAFLQAMRSASANGDPLKKQDILDELSLLLLHRRPDADPLPGAWTGVSGKMEMELEVETGSTQHKQWETPVPSAAREIAEETGQTIRDLRLKAALQPYVIEAGKRKWQVWPMLWNRVVLPDEQMDPLEELVVLNSENVGCKWDKLVEMEKLPGKVPGLMGTFDRLIDAWIVYEQDRGIWVRNGQRERKA